MRGALVLTFWLNRELRIIPADAGSTLTDSPARQDNMDHPRGCGEHHPTYMLHPNTKGSSPRMRGALRILLLVGTVLRIIPADAGSTP